MSRRYRDSNAEYAGIQCGCWGIMVFLNLIFGGMSVNYLLETFATKTIPFFWCAVIGLFTGQFTIPVAVVVAILKAFEVI